MKQNLIIAISLAVIFSHAKAETFNLPVQLDYSLIKKVLASQVYKSGQHSAEVWHDKHGCSFLRLANPQISGNNGQIRLLNDVETQFGTHLGGKCLTVLQWQGVLETFQKPVLGNNNTLLTLPVTQANAYDQQGRKVQIKQLQELIAKVAAPKLADVKLDLVKSRPDIEKTLASYLPKEHAPNIKQVANSLHFNSVEAKDNGIAVSVGFDSQPVPPKKPASAFTPEELKQWQAHWKEWEAFLVRAIRRAAADTKSPELQATLNGILADARVAFQAGLKAHDSKQDPIRVFFHNTWQKLSPQLYTVAKQLPEAQGLRYLTFIAATDLLYEVEKIGAPLGLELSSDGLRQLGRILLSKQTKPKPVG